MTKPLWIQAAAVFAGSLAFLMLLAPTAPFTKELGVLESAAVKDIFAGHVVLPSFAPYEPGSDIQAPPLSWWIDAAMVRVLGWNELAFRLPALIASAATCAILFLWLAHVAGPRAGFWAAASLLFCHYFADAARQPRMDAMLTTFVTASTVCLERALFGHPGRRLMLLVAAAILMALGTMTKGPLGLLLPALVLGTYCLVTRRLRKLFSWDVLASFAGGAALVMPWYVAAYRVGGEHFLQWQIYGVLFHRFFSADILGRLYCRNPFYYFIPITFAGFLPWTLYLPALPLWLWRRSAPPQAAIFSLCWFSAIFLFFSSSTGKCFVYILPAFPGLAATFGLLVDYLDKPGADTAVTRTFSAGSAILGIGGLVTGAATMLLAAAGPIPALSRHLHSDDRRYVLILGSLVGHPAFIFFMLAWIGGALALLMGWRLRLMRLQLGGAVALASAGTAFWLGAMNPALSRRQSLKAFAGQVDAIVPATATIDFIGPMDYDFGFYSNHAVGHADDFDCSSPSHGRHYLVVYQDGFARLSSSRTKCLNLIATSPSVDRHGTRMLFTDGAPP